MVKNPFRANLLSENGLVILDLHGEINAFAEAALTETYGQAEQLNPAVIALDFSDVQYINSTGIALIVSLLAQARKAQRRLVVYGLNDHYVEIFKITRLSDFMTIFDDAAGARALVQ